MAYQEDEEGLLNDILEGKDGQRVQVMAEGEGLTRQGKIDTYNSSSISRYERIFHSSARLSVHQQCVSALID